ncbi:MAG: c-type cytochrome [Gallionellaceae bacterium]
MSIRYSLIFTLSLLFSGNVFAVTGAELADEHDCIMCHDIESKVNGPSFKAIAAKYKGDNGAQAILEKKVRSGGSGVWYNMMPPTPTWVSDEEIKSMVEWVLSLK